MDYSRHLSGARESLLSSHRLEARAYCQYLSATARGVAQEELLILGLTRELALLQREVETSDTARAVPDDSRLLAGTVIGRWLANLGLLALARLDRH